MSSQIPPSLQAEIERLQALQAQLQNVLVLKQQVENELKEIERTISEIEKVPPDSKIFKIVGTFLISVSKEQALNELKEREELLKLNLTSLSKQESMLRKQIEELRLKISEALRQAGMGGGAPSGGGG
ncbi:MAG: prefoldin subunit beta [Crenarchaeota archaeon]|nr:prefoldin subunit beta [Thermoproteota archaeon]